MVQHEQPYEYSHHGHIALQQEPAPIHESRYSQSAEEQGHNHGQSSQSINHYAQNSEESPKSEEEYAPIYQYVQAQHEEQSHHAPAHHKGQTVVVPQHHSQGHEVQYSPQFVAFHHGPQLHHGAQEAELHHGAQEVQLNHEAQLHHAPSHHQVESNSHKSHHHEEPVDYYVSQSKQINYVYGHPTPGLLQLSIFIYSIHNILLNHE